MRNVILAGRQVYIRTFGCQMNDHDSERVRDLLCSCGCYIVAKPDEADVLLFNTCSVRENAENRVYGVVGSLKRLRKKRTDVIFGIIGCMAEAHKEKIFEKLPHVNFICGPSNLDKIPDMINKVMDGGNSLMFAGGERSKRMPSFPKERILETGYVKITEGCDNFCSYCIVPYVRGKERSKSPKEILSEIRSLLNEGAGKITLLGQNVNSYGKGLREKISFPDLLRKIDKIVDGKTEIDFITSHPKDASVELFNVMNECESISKALHMPLQSGSDKILKKMNRGYTLGKYKKLVNDFRKIVKDGTVASDFIVGFPGETKKDFNDTLKAVKEIKFSGAYIFKYSPRSFTKASEYKDDVSREEKERRHKILLNIQKETYFKNLKS